MSKLVSIIAVLFLLTGCVEAVYKIIHKGEDTAKTEALKLSALQGDIESQYRLGKYYCCGESPEFDNVAALKWYCMAAKEGQRDAMLEVGKLYETSHKYEGSIIPRNNVLAYTYYKKSHENGNDKAFVLMQNIEKFLSESDMKHAAYLDEQWPVIGCEVTR